MTLCIPIYVIWVCSHTVAMLKAKNSGIVKGSLAQLL